MASGFDLTAMLARGRAVAGQGKNGASAYEIWLGQGNIGSVADFLDSLKGQDATPIITQNTGESTDKVMSQKAVTDALAAFTTLPYGGSKEWLEQNGDRSQLYQINGYIWAYIESDGWTRSETPFLVVNSEGAMSNAGGTPYLLRNGNEGRVYAYTEASGDAGIPVYDSKPTTANEGVVIAVGGRKYKATLTSGQVPSWTRNYADLTDTSDNNWKAGYRIGSSGTSTSSTASPAPMVTNYVACAVGDVVRVKGLTLGGSNCAIYNDQKTVGSAAKPTFPGTGTSSWDSEMEGTDVYKFTITLSSAGFIRFGGVPVGSASDVIITVNEEINYRTETTVTWTDIGVYTPPVSAGWSATDETYAVIDTLSGSANSGDSAVYSVDGYLYSYIAGSAWVQTSKYNAPTIAVDGELSDSSKNAVQNKVITEELSEVKAATSKNETSIAVINKKIANISTSENVANLSEKWQIAVNACIAKIKGLQVGRNCVTFAFFSDNHQNTNYLGDLIGAVMKECNISYCIFGGDAISNGTLTDEATMIANDKAFDDAMKPVAMAQMCRAVGNHDGYWVDESGAKHRYNRAQIYDLFMRQESIAQNKHYGGDGTYFYVDDVASNVRFVICNTNYNYNTASNTLDIEQIEWLANIVFNESDKSKTLVFVSHQPITNNFHSNIYADTAHAIQNLLIEKINEGWNVVGWFSGHIHADRIYQTDHTDNTEANDQTTVSLPWKTVTICSDHTGISRDDDMIRDIYADSAETHAIDFVTINKTERKVNITRLGIGEDREYSYQ